jgi:allantoin racemase
MRLLVVNPNTTAAVTAACAEVARRVAAPGTEIVPLTGEFGARIISSRAENAVAQHALMTLLAKNADGADAVLLAVSYDTGLLAARELLNIPVVGMTEAGMIAALLLGARFGVVTFGTPDVYRELIRERGFDSRLAGLVSVETAATDAYAKPQAVAERVVAAANRLVEEDRAEAVVLCGAAMAGMAAKLRDHVPVPLVDGIAAGVPLCEMLVRLGTVAPRRGSLVTPAGRETVGLDPALAALLGREG